jgi:hypothetical protein
MAMPMLMGTGWPRVIEVEIGILRIELGDVTAEVARVPSMARHEWRGVLPLHYRVMACMKRLGLGVTKTMIQIEPSCVLPRLEWWELHLNSVHAKHFCIILHQFLLAAFQPQCLMSNEAHTIQAHWLEPMLFI